MQTRRVERWSNLADAIGELYDINPVAMMRDPKRSGQEIADPDRYDRAEENIAAARRGRLKAV